jgi:hypothetical protein
VAFDPALDRRRSPPTGHETETFPQGMDFTGPLS